MDKINEIKAVQSNVMGMHFVRPPILDFNKIKENKDYIEYEINTDNLTSKRTSDNFLDNYLNSFIFCNTNFNIKCPKKNYMIKNGKKRFAYAVGMFPAPKTGQASYLDGCILAALGLRRQGTNADIICFITPDISEEDKKNLEVVFDKVIYVPYISPYEMSGKGDLKTIKIDGSIFDNCEGYTKMHPYVHVFFKLHIFNPTLFPYEKVCFIDSDLVPLNYYDSLFMLDCPAGWVEYRKKVPYLESYNWDRCDFLKHGSKIPKLLTDIDTPAGSDVNAGLLLVEPNLKEYNEMIKELQSPLHTWMGKDKYHKGFYHFDFDTPLGNKFVKNSYCFPEQNYLTKRYSGKWTYIEFAFQSWALDPCNAFGIHMAAFNPKPWFKQPKAGSIEIKKKYLPYVKDTPIDFKRLPIALKEDDPTRNYMNITYSYVIFNELIIWGLVNYNDLKEFFIHKTEIHGKKISADKDLFKPLKQGKGNRKEVQFKLLKDIKKDGPYWYKLSKSQQQISNLLNDYDNNVEKIRNNYLQLCRGKLVNQHGEYNYNFKILEYPNFKDVSQRNKEEFLKQNKYPFGKNKGKNIDELDESFIKFVVNSSIYKNNKDLRKVLNKSKHKSLIIRLNKKKLESKSKSKSGGRKNKRTKKRSKKHDKRTKKFLGQKTLYYFYADYCIHCKRFNPLWEKLKKQMENEINFIEIDGKDVNNNLLIKKYNIKTFPSLVINNKKFEGDRDEEKLKNFIN